MITTTKIICATCGKEVIKRATEIARQKKKGKKPFYRDWETDRKSTRLNSSHSRASRMPSSA